MMLGKVIGTVVTTISHRDYKNRRLLVVQPLGLEGDKPDEDFIALDNTQAGVGDLCVMVRSREAALAMPDVKFVPIDLALVGIVDELAVRPDGEYDLVMKRGWNAYT